jgi:class I fructose-bisphosphate aldolase
MVRTAAERYAAAAILQSLNHVNRGGGFMPTINRDLVRVPADVPAEFRETYVKNFLAATRNSGRLMLFACDQKIEHLNDDFFGEGISADDNEPEHLFRIGSQGVVGVLAGQRGLVAQFAPRSTTW